jgi:hypothetical protein|tara:strand:+ start:188 stop:574 length:387 start_codon:yes stop_codon:yes gene_type:complete
MFNIRTALVATTLLLGDGAVVIAADATTVMELVMIEQPGCQWCARWNAEIAPIYPKTPEAAQAPLRRIDLHGPMPDDLTLSRPAIFTPTFVLTVAGTEVSRIEGYPGPDFFWGLLDDMLSDAGGDVIN